MYVSSCWGRTSANYRQNISTRPEPYESSLQKLAQAAVNLMTQSTAITELQCPDCNYANRCTAVFITTARNPPPDSALLPEVVKIAIQIQYRGLLHKDKRYDVIALGCTPKNRRSDQTFFKNISCNMHCDVIKQYKPARRTFPKLIF